jgi:hypothetical protein
VTAGETAAAAFTEEIASIRAKLQPVYAELDRRLRFMAVVFNGAPAGLVAAQRRAGRSIGSPRPRTGVRKNEA